MFKEFYDWFIAPPAYGLARLMLLPIGVAPLVATGATWYLVVLQDDFLPHRLRKFKLLIGILLCAYVLFVTSTAVLKLPHVAYETFLKDNDDD